MVRQEWAVRWIHSNEVCKFYFVAFSEFMQQCIVITESFPLSQILLQSSPKPNDNACYEVKLQQCHSINVQLVATTNSASLLSILSNTYVTLGWDLIVGESRGVAPTCLGEVSNMTERYKIVTGKYEDVATVLAKVSNYVTKGNDFRLEKTDSK